MPGPARSASTSALAAALRKLARAIDETRFHPGIPPEARARLLDLLEGAAHHATKALAASAGRPWLPGDPALIAARGEFGFYELLERYGASRP
jgi:hypothetical protein